MQGPVGWAWFALAVRRIGGDAARSGEWRRGRRKAGGGLGDGDAALFEPRDGVDGVDAIGVNLEVQVGAGGEATVAHAANPLAAGDALAGGNAEGLEVAVDGDGAGAVEDADPLGVALR